MGNKLKIAGISERSRIGSDTAQLRHPEVSVDKQAFLRALAAAVLFCGVSAGSSDAASIVIDFSVGPAGTVVPQTFTDGSGLTADAFYLVGGVWTQTSLFRRIEAPDDLGFGVCSPGESCGSGLGGGDFNELSNLTSPELIRLTLPDGYTWVSVSVSSMDDNGSTDLDNVERGQMWASDSSSPSTSLGALFGGSALWQITGGDPNQSFSGFTAATSGSQYLFFEAYDFLNGTNTNNDYLIHSVTLEEPTDVDELPEPATLMLIGPALVAWRAQKRHLGRSATR